MASEQEETRMDWFHEAKFGMFIHWGIYAVPAGEWNGNTNHAEWIMLTANIPSAEYEELTPQFNPVKFDAQAWVSVAKEAGMKYLVITAKHHDGFCMYDTKLTDYSIVKATPYKQDPMRDLAQACAEAGLEFCFYYSVPDWHHPEFPAKYSQRGFHGAPNPDADIGKYAEYMKGQVSELLTDYGPIGILWFDDGGSFRDYNKAELLRGQEIVDVIHELQPACLINNRLGVGADYGTPEQQIPSEKQQAAFEVCMTLNRHWGYNKHDDDWKEAPEVIHKLVDICSKGGNFLLNVGPTAEGLFPEDSIRILREAGKWLEVNGEAIYGTTANPFDYTPNWGRVTAKPGKLYLHVFDCPDDRSLQITEIGDRVGKVYLLADTSGSTLDFEQSDSTVKIALPSEGLDPTDTVIVLEYAGRSVD